MSSPAAAKAATRYQRTFHGHASRVAQVRRDIAAYLDGCPAADDAILIVSEIVTNAIVHSESNGASFTVRSETCRDYLWIECEDLGGPWHRPRPDDRPHGLDIIEALAGPGNWGTETTGNRGRIVWARLYLPRPGGPRMTAPAGPVTPGAPAGEDHLASQLRAAPEDELRAARRDLQTGIAMMRRGSPMHAPATAYLAAITAELNRRAR